MEGNISGRRRIVARGESDPSWGINAKTSRHGVLDSKREPKGSLGAQCTHATPKLCSRARFTSHSPSGCWRERDADATRGQNVVRALIRRRPCDGALDAHACVAAQQCSKRLLNWALDDDERHGDRVPRGRAAAHDMPARAQCAVRLPATFLSLSSLPFYLSLVQSRTLRRR